MNYQKTLDYLYRQLPMFHRVGPAAYKADLHNTLAICRYLEHPEKKFRSIHIAGTNGKGSSSHMLAAILQQCGYKTGLYTSPHLLDFRERIRINGKMISKKYVKDFVAQHKEKFEQIAPSFFEWTVGLAFDYFAKEKVDVAVIETGLGGRLDSTNVIRPLVSLITNIGFDHTQLLGNTLEKIAGEKAGIIKKKTPVVISERQKETEKVFIKKAKKEGAAIFFAQDEFFPFFHRLKKEGADACVIRKSSGEFEVYHLDLAGSYQQKNIAGVLQVLDVLRKKRYNLPEEKVKKALAQVSRITGLRGRFERLQEHPQVICDTGHNAEGLAEVMEMLKKIKYRKLHFIFGVVNDKDPSALIKILPQRAAYYFTRAAIPRALDQQELRRLAARGGLKGKTFPSVGQAYEAAMARAQKNDLVFIGGSTFVVADALACIREHRD